MEHKTTLKACVHHNKDGYFQGQVSCIIDGVLRWSEKIDMIRLTHEDALADAVRERDDIAEYNLLVKSSGGMKI